MSKPDLRRPPAPVIADLLPRLLEVLQKLPYGPSVALGRCVGTVAFHLYGPDRERVLGNLALAFPEATPQWRRGVAKETFRHWVSSALEALHFVGHPDAVASRVRWVNREPLLAAAGEARGLMVLTSHFGNYGLLVMALAALGLEPAVIGKKPHRPETVSGAFSNYQREVLLPRIGVSLIKSYERPAAEIAQRLGAGGTVVVLGDFPEGRARTRAAFLGMQQEFATGSAMIAKSTGADVVQMLTRRDGFGAHTITVESIHPVGDVQQLVEDYARLTEEYVLRDPAQWLWLHRAWKSEAAP
ncbi:MAG TPA: hypothetical protein VF587_05165 [Solirubrobacteraceae bacterium]